MPQNINSENYIFFASKKENYNFFIVDKNVYEALSLV